MIKRTLTRLVITIGSAVLVPLSVMCAPHAESQSQKTPAVFERRHTTMTDTFDVGSAGATLRVADRGTPTDGVVVEIPPRSIDEPTRVEIGYSTGALSVQAGTPSGVVLVVTTTPEVTFQNYVTIRVSFPPNPSHQSLVGYAIDAEGRLRPIDLIDLDMQQGRVSFLTFRPLSLTWIYIDN